MNPLIQALVFLIDIISSLYLSLIMLRFLLQWVRADFYNPFAQFILQVTNPLLRPVRRIVPSALGLDTASLTVAYLVQVIAFAFLATLQGQFTLLTVWAWLFAPIILLITLILHIYLAATIFLFIVTLLTPYNDHPLAVLSYQLLRPLLMRLNRHIPAFHGVDFSPMVIVIGVGLIKILFISPLMKALLAPIASSL